MGSKQHYPGESLAVCADCGARIVVPTAAGVPPYLSHEPECGREGWPIDEAIKYEDGLTATVNDWPNGIDHATGRDIAEGSKQEVSEIAAGSRVKHRVLHRVGTVERTGVTCGRGGAIWAVVRWDDKAPGTHVHTEDLRAIGDSADETDARAYVETSARGLIGDLRALTRLADEPYVGVESDRLQALGIDFSGDADSLDEQADTLLCEMPLAVEATTTFEVVLGVGGPDRVLCFECDQAGPEGDVTPDNRFVPAGRYGVRRVFYRYSWDGSAEVELTGEDREVAEAFGRRVVPELGE